jgi:enterochelin esterase-like enzyme
LLTEYGLHQKITMPLNLKEISVSTNGLKQNSLKMSSLHLNRVVTVHLLYPANMAELSQPLSVLWLNDGQDMKALGVEASLKLLLTSNQIKPVFVVAIEAGDRLAEYGTMDVPDYKKRGGRARAYADFLLQELVPFVRKNYPISAAPADNVFAGLSLGGVSALDITWHYPQYFQKTAVFSGAFWWRKKALNAGYTDNDRIVHQRIRMGTFKPGLKFWLQTGTLDETTDRNNNGIIDSIDDTKDLITELILKGYQLNTDIQYVEVEGGKHHASTWSKVFPQFLAWAFKK